MAATMAKKSKIAEDSNRAGHYQRQPSGYAAFIPKPLPPDPPLVVDDEMQTLLSKADRALGRLDGSIQTLPNPDLFVLMYVRKEAVLSSQIEGTQSSLDDVLEVEARLMGRRHPSDTTEVLNYVRAMNHGLRRLNELPISIRLIKEIHKKLLENVRGRERHPGQLRSTQNWIGPSGCTLSEAVFVPPPANMVVDALGALENMIHSQAVVPDLLKIGLIHSQFETIHPFLDGNGRVGRLLITFLLCEKRILMSPVLYISHYFKKHRSNYYECLQRVRDHGEWEAWLKFFLAGITEVSLEATETARKIVDLRETHRTIVTHEFGRAAGSGLTVLEHLFRSPIMTVSDVGALLDITFPAANRLVERFVEQQILHEITGQSRYRVFRYTPYVNLFAANDAGRE